MIPITIFIVLGLVKLLIQKSFDADMKMYDTEEFRVSKIINPDPLEDLAEADMLFCDKTGTLTKNKLTFKYMEICKEKENLRNEVGNLDDWNFDMIEKGDTLNEMLRCILLCNDAIRVKGALQCSNQDEKVLLDEIEDKC